MPPTDGLTIGQVSELLGVPVPTLRSWHLRYGIALPARTGGGHRRYRESDVALLQAFGTAIARGLAPRTAAQGLREPHQQSDLPVTLLADLMEHVRAGDQPAFGDVLDRAARDLGMEGAVDRLLIPAMHETGRRWELGHCDVGIEHLATVAARAWIAQRVGQVGRLREVAPVLLAGAPGNEHTVALEAFELLLRCRGWPTRQLGANTPVTALLSAARSSGARTIVVTAHQSSRRRAAVGALTALAAQTTAKLFFAGASFDSLGHRRDVPGTYLGTSLSEAADLVEDQSAAR